VARGSEEQSDSIDEIAGAANSLSSAAKRVAQLVGEFKLGNTPARGTPVDDYRLSGALSNRSGNARSPLTLYSGRCSVGPQAYQIA